MKFFETLRQSRLLTIIWSMSIFTLGYLLMWFVGFLDDLSLPMLLAAPVVGIVLGLMKWELKRVRSKEK